MKHIVLIGYRGTGKSTVGRNLAVKLDLPFADTDDLIRQETGKTVRELVEEGGWPLFRFHEKQVIQKLAENAAPGTVIASGGGVFDDGECRGLMQSKGVFVWLYADLYTIIERIAGDTEGADRRPPLDGADAVREAAAVLERRIPVYRSLAAITVNTEGKTIEEIVSEIHICLAMRECQCQETP